MSKINVTKTFLPPLDEYLNHLNKIWESSWLTNRGELVNDLEEKLKRYLEVEFLTLTTNGTLPIQLALKQIASTGSEIITTPFSYVATTSSIVWEGFNPVFVDIHPEYLTIDEKKIESAITSRTSAILATHVFGNPCNVEVIEQIADRYNLQVIYDAAHCFGVKYKNKSIFNYGDVSTCSFHATKIFHTAEGGCWTTSNKELQEKIYFSHNFGHKGPGTFFDVGINAKMSELQAAMGLSVFPYISELITKRKRIDEIYNNGLDFTRLTRLKIRKQTEWNYSYYPIIFEDENTLMRVFDSLIRNEINTRRYFYPSLNMLPYVDQVDLPISQSIANRILCLPAYHDIRDEDLEHIIRIINTELI